MMPTWDDVQKGSAVLVEGERPCDGGCMWYETNEWLRDGDQWTMTERDVPFCCLKNKDIPDGVCKGHFIEWAEPPEAAPASSQMTIFDVLED